VSLYNNIKLCEAWSDGLFEEVAEEASKMKTADLIDFLIVFMRDKGQKEIDILKRFLD
jgi:hypothetical protein